MRCPSFLAATALLIAVAAVGGCTSSGTAAAPSCTTPGVTPDQIKLGVIYPDSGTLATTFGAVRSGIDARLGEVNDAGGVNGRKIVYDWRDDRSTPVANSLAGRDLVEQQHVFGVIESTLAAGGSAPYFSQKGIPVTGLAAEEIWSKYRNMFSFSYTAGGAVDTYGQFIKSQGGHRFVLLQTALSTGVSDAAARHVAGLKAAGLDFAGQVNFTSGADSPEVAAQQIIAMNADTVLAVVQPPDYTSVLTALRNAGRPPAIMMAVSGYDRRVLRTYGPGMAGVIVPAFYWPFESGGPAIQKYEKAMATYSPQLAQPEQDFGIMSYIQADMFIRGLEAAGPCPTRESFINGLRSVRRYDAGGLINPVDFQTGLGKPTTCYSFLQATPDGTAFTVLARNVCGHEVPTR